MVAISPSSGFAIFCMFQLTPIWEHKIDQYLTYNLCYFDSLLASKKFDMDRYQNQLTLFYFIVDKFFNVAVFYVLRGIVVVVTSSHFFISQWIEILIWNILFLVIVFMRVDTQRSGY